MKPTLKMLGDWKKEIGVPLADALAVSMNIIGRSGEQACKHALILMAQSARALTKQSKKNRTVKRSPRARNAPYVENWRQGQQRPQFLYKFQFEPGANKITGSWENARKIGNRGLAKRAWMWGLAKLKPMSTGKAIPGASKVYALTRTEWKGYIKENRLDYIMKAMPAGWESIVEQKAGNKIMSQARSKLERKWRREMGLPRRRKHEPSPDAAFLARYFSAA